jgi:hypothetical protein
MKKILFIVLFAIFSINTFAQVSQARFDLTDYGVKIEPDRRLMVVMASLEAAGMETPLTEKGAEFRRKLRADLQDLSPDLRQKLKTFIDQYKRRHANASQAEMISPFVSMAYTLSPAPDLLDPARATDLPGDLLEVLDFAPLVREFYRRSFNTKIDGYYKDYQTAGDGLRRPAVEMVSQLLEYLHTRPQLTYAERVKTNVPSANKKKTLEKVEVREHDRRFFIVPELLAAKGTINFRNVGDDYYTIVPPDTDLNRLEVRHAYLQFVIDPLVASNAKDIATFRAGIKTLLDEQRKQNPNISPDIFLAVSRSLVAAVDSRQSAYQKYQTAIQSARQNNSKPLSEQTDAQGRKVFKLTEELSLIDNKTFAMPTVDDRVALELSEAYERGAVLAFYFADQLKGLEYSGTDIAGSLRDVILSLDTSKETNRLAQFAEARKRALLTREELLKNAGSSEAIIKSPVTKKLLDIDEIIKAKNYTAAETELKQLLGQNPSEPRIYYALGRVSSLSAEGASEEQTKHHLLAAKKAYENTILTISKKAVKTDSDVALLSLSYVAIARIHEFYGETEYAIKIYEAAVKIGDVADGAYKQAVEARERLMKDQ